MKTIKTTASVKIMLSYDYSHFEINMGIQNDEGVSIKDIDNARKDCQRLADKAVSQYKTAKEKAASRTDGQYRMQNFLSQIKIIESKPEGDRTLNEIAMLKQYRDEDWQSQFEEKYDYDDDENYPF